MPLLSDVVAIAAGDYHTCALTNQGEVKCWGSNTDGQLGNGMYGSQDNQYSPVSVLGLESGVRVIAAGGSFTCALTVDGRVMCWGSDSEGQLGNSQAGHSVGFPVEVSGLSTNVQSISLGAAHACALSTDGAVKCWGSNRYGQLGDGTGHDSPEPVDVMELEPGVKGITTGATHTCSLSADTGVNCWGRNYAGALGAGVGAVTYTPVMVNGLETGISDVAAGNEYSCALTETGAVKCLGLNYNGILGNGTLTSSYFPVDVIDLEAGVHMLAAGHNHVCALTIGGEVKCWGHVMSSSIGDLNPTTQPAPKEIPELGIGNIAVTVGAYHSCVLHGGGTVSCWGNNETGQLGGGVESYNFPASIVNELEPRVERIEAGKAHTCALTDEGAVMCWGANDSGQLGDGTNSHRYTPAEVHGMESSIQAIAAGSEHTCALTVDGARCWGLNQYGQLGDDTRIDSNTPRQVQGLESGVSGITAGLHHTCVLTLGGEVKCWGRNNVGQLGDGTTVDRLVPGRAVDLGTVALAITAGDEHTCALTVLRTIKCWGSNSSGQLGIWWGLSSSSTAIDVGGLGSGVRALEAGGRQTCAIVQDGHVKCWGGYSIPADVRNLDASVQAIAVGTSVTCALTVNGSVKCWENPGRQSSSADLVLSSTIDLAFMGTGVEAITRGGNHGCALAVTGYVKCWGRNGSGQLGHASTGVFQDVVDVAPSEIALVYLSSSDHSNIVARQPRAYFVDDTNLLLPVIDIVDTSIFQSSDGLGASLTDASAWLIWNQLDPDRRAGLLGDLFNPADGLGLSIVRLPMGASEFYTGTAYTYDDNGGIPDPDLTNFSIAHDEQYIIPILQQIKTINPAVKIIAAPWSAPAWMKDSGRLEGGKLKPEYYAVYADYFLRFVQAYAAHGLPIYAVSLQNEPEHESTTYPTMLFPADDAARFVADHLGPLFEANDIQTQIWIWDHNWDNPGYPLSVLSNPAARGYIQATAFHAYTGMAANQTTVHDAWPHKDIQFTEQSGGEWDADFGSNLKWGVQNLLIGATRNWAKSVLRWNIALNTENGPHQGGCSNCLGLVTIDESARNFTYENDYYLLGHLSRFPVCL